MSNKVNKDRGNKEIIVFKKDEYEIKEYNKVKFKSKEKEEGLPLVSIYILEKLKND